GNSSGECAFNSAAPRAAAPAGRGCATCATLTSPSGHGKGPALLLGAYIAAERCPDWFGKNRGFEKIDGGEYRDPARWRGLGRRRECLGGRQGPALPGRSQLRKVRRESVSAGDADTRQNAHVGERGGHRHLAVRRDGHGEIEGQSERRDP